MLYELYYAEKDLQGDIPCYQLDSQSELLNLINGFRNISAFHKLRAKHSQVYLCAIENVKDNDGVILVDDKAESINFFITCMTNLPGKKKIYLQIYGSYEDAYKVALDMKEVNPLCYNRDVEIQIAFDNIIED